jgi:hypothetical protein
MLEARVKNWRYEQADGKRWGDKVEANYQAYLDCMLAQGIIKNKADPILGPSMNLVTWPVP